MQKFLVDEKRRNLAQIETMIDDFRRKQDDLQAQIEAEQTRTGIADVTHFAYPTFAKAASVRRDNLVASVEGLESQRDDARAVLEDAVGELKRLELLDEREEHRRRSDVARAEQSVLDEVAMGMHRG
jgi:flagellar export protein FliJ